MSGRRVVRQSKMGQRCRADAIISASKDACREACHRDLTTHVGRAELRVNVPRGATVGFVVISRRQSSWKGNPVERQRPPPRASPFPHDDWQHNSRTLQQPILGVAGTMTDQSEAVFRQRRWEHHIRPVMDFAREAGTSELFMQLALGKVTTCPFRREGPPTSQAAWVLR